MRTRDDLLSQGRPSERFRSRRPSVPVSPAGQLPAFRSGFLNPTSSLRSRVPRTSEADLQAVSSEHDAAGLPRGDWGIFDVLGLTLVVVAGVLVLVPALVHGTSLGPYDILQNSGLNRVPKVRVHNSTVQDQIRLFIPWTSLVWTQVHQGHLPLWNPYSAARDAPRVQLGVGSAEPSCPDRIPVPRPTRLHRPTGRHRRDRRHGRLRAREGASPRDARQHDGGDRLRVERPLHRVSRLADVLGHVLGRLALCRRRPGPPRREQGSVDRASRRRSHVRHLCRRSRG